jgi:hypothetical protein
MFDISFTYMPASLIAFMAFTFSSQYSGPAGFMGTALVAFTIVLFALFFVLLYESGKKVRYTKSGKVERPSARIFLLMIPFVCLAIFAIFFYPSTVVIDDAIVNVIEHYVGLIAGIITSFFLGSWEYERAHPRTSPPRIA